MKGAHWYYMEHEGVRYWIETDREYGALRQITVDEDGAVQVSCRDDCLAEGICAPDEHTMELARHIFEWRWRDATEQYRTAWRAQKKQYPVGREAWGRICYFYPQGIVVDLEEGLQAVCDYDACRAASDAGAMYPGHTVTGTVAGYDEDNLWIMLDRCRAE